MYLYQNQLINLGRCYQKNHERDLNIFIGILFGMVEFTNLIDIDIIFLGRLMIEFPTRTKTIF